MQNYKVKFKKAAFESLNSFIMYRIDNYIQRFNDTGLYNIGDMIYNYLEDQYKLRNEFEYYIINMLSLGVLGELTEEGNGREKKIVILRLRGYIIKINCVKFIKQKIIVVEDIHIKT